jgi:hypothetical protein
MPPADRPRRGLAWLILATAAIAMTWLVVLPWVGSLRPVKNYIRRNEAAGVNPGAMYYTEIDAIGAIGERMEPRTESGEEFVRGGE